MERWKESIFFENEEMPEEDIRLFETMPKEGCSDEERRFFEQMRAKETGEFAPSADLMLSEHDNEDGLFLVRYYFTEYKLGQRSEQMLPSLYHDSLAEMLEEDVCAFTGRHQTFLNWLRDRQFKGMAYRGNYAIKGYDYGA